MTLVSVLRSLASVQRPPTKGAESEMSSGAWDTAGSPGSHHSHPQKVLGCRVSTPTLNMAADGIK